MQNSEIEQLLMEKLGLAEVHVTGDGSHFQIIAVSDQFDETTICLCSFKRHYRARYYACNLD